MERLGALPRRRGSLGVERPSEEPRRERYTDYGELRAHSPGRFEGGTIRSFEVAVEVAVDQAQYLDLELELRRSLRD